MNWRAGGEFTIQNVELFDIAHSNDGETAVVVGQERNSRTGFVGVVNPATGAVLFKVSGLQHWALCVVRLALAAGGCCFVVGFSGGSLRAFQQDEMSKELVEMDPLPKRHTLFVCSVAVSSSGRVLASASWDSTVCLWDVDLATGAITPRETTLRHPDVVRAVAWSPTDEDLLATGCEDGHVRLFDVRAGAENPVATIDQVRYQNAALCLAFDPSGETIAAGYYLGEVARWEARAPYTAVGAPIKAHIGVSCMQYSPCGIVLATGAYDKMVKLWDALGPELVALADNPVLRGHTNWVKGLEFNPSDPSVLVSCGDDGMVRRWNVPECAERLPFEGPSPPDSPAHVSFPDDSSSAAEGSSLHSSSSHSPSSDPSSSSPSSSSHHRRKQLRANLRRLEHRTKERRSHPYSRH